MASTYSPTLRIELIATGEQSGLWGDTTNTNLGSIIEQAITGVQTIPINDANYTLTALNGSPDQSRNAVLNVTSLATLTAVRSIIIPSVEKTYTVRNATTGGYGITIRTSGGTGVTIRNGGTMQVYCNGTDVFSSTTYLPSLTVDSITFTAGTTGTGNIVYATSPTLSTPTITNPTVTTGSFTTPTLVNPTVTTGTFDAPTFTGVPVAPTAAVGTNTTQVATTAFVLANSIPTSGTGFAVRTGAGTTALRNITVTGAGISITNGDGVAGNPVISNTGVTSIAGSAGITLSASTGSVTASPTSGYNGYGVRTVSTAAPSGGNNGDIWYQV